MGRSDSDESSDGSDFLSFLSVEIFYLRLLVSSSRCYTGIIFSTAVIGQLIIPLRHVEQRKQEEKNS